MPKQFALPDLGEGITEAQIIRLLVKDGDRVAEDQYLMEVETDKAAVEIPSPFSGVATQVHVKEGDTVNVGDVIVTFDGEGASGTKIVAPAGAGAKQREPEPAASSRTAGAPRSGGVAAATAETATRDAPPRKTTAPAAPAVRKLAREFGVDLDLITGTGPGGRISKEDVERSAGDSRDRGAPPSGKPSEAAATRRAAPRFAPPPGEPGKDKWGSIRTDSLSQIRKTIANQMKRSAFTIPHVTHADEADITQLDRLRREINEATDNDPKLTVMAFVIRATCLALHKYPIFNASFEEEKQQIIYKEYINMGIAVDTQRGLIVPVIRNADELTMRGLAMELRTIAENIRTNQFAIEDLRGGTFTITNVGALGGTFSTPIINHPEVAILGLGRSRKMPVVKDDQVTVGLILPINVSFDHRATDGANAARFTGEIINYIENPGKFLLD